MTRTVPATLVALVAACAAAWRLGGTEGTGVIVGFLVGAWVAGLGTAWQLHAARTRPAQVMNAGALSFLAELAVLVVLGLVFRYLDVAGERVDWRSFVVTYTAAVLVVMIPGALDSARVLRERQRAAALAAREGAL